MKRKIYDVEGIQVELEELESSLGDAERRFTAYAMKQIRNESGMSRKEFAEWLGIPYRTLQDWELGNSKLQQYFIRLIAYKVSNEKKKGNI